MCVLLLQINPVSMHSLTLRTCRRSPSTLLSVMWMPQASRKVHRPSQLGKATSMTLWKTGTQRVKLQWEHQPCASLQAGFSTACRLYLSTSHPVAFSPRSGRTVMDSLFRKTVCSHIQEWPSINGSQSQDIHVWNTHFLLSSFFFLTVFYLSLSSSVLNLSFLSPPGTCNSLQIQTQISLSFLRAPPQPDLQSGDRNLNIGVIIYSEKLQCRVEVHLTERAHGALSLSLICFAWPSPSLPDSSLDSVMMGGDLGGGVKPQAMECSSFPSLLTSRVAFASDCCEIDRCRRIAANTQSVLRQ